MASRWEIRLFHASLVRFFRLLFVGAWRTYASSLTSLESLLPPPYFDS
jgi:hypothetical protein